MRLSIPTAALFALLTVLGHAAAFADPYTTQGTPIPDSTIIARVGDRAISAYAYRDNYFASDATLRPRPDSLGRATFLEDLVNKEILGLSSQKTGYKFSFEDRVEMREFHDQMLSNMLFMRTVQDSSAIGEDSLRHVYGFYGRELKLRLLYFADRSQADYVRLQLISGRLSWSVALTRYGVQSTTVKSGLSDWIKFQSLPIEIALQIWPLRIGEVSPIILASSGYHIVQVAEERTTPLAPFSSLKSFVKLAVRGVETSARKEHIQTEAKQGMNVVYDSTNVRWAAAHFRETVKFSTEALGANNINVDEDVPAFEPADTARVLVRWKDGRLTLGVLLHEYSDMQPIMRPSINTPERMMSFADALILAPRMVQFAIDRGIDKDPSFVAQVDRRREAILVGHMVEDSVLSRVSVTREERHAYYDSHHDAFTSFPQVRFANIVRRSKAAADSVRALLAAGASVDSIVAADKKLGVVGSDFGQLGSGDQSNLHKILFEELRPGKSTILGPDRDKLYAVLYEVSYDPGHLLPYEQLESTIDESVRNIKGDQALRAFIARHAKAYRIETHPELLMRILLADPGADRN